MQPPHGSVLMMKANAMLRAGFTLVEVMIALVLTAVIGAAVTSVLVTQSRFYDEQEKVSSARAVSRAAQNIMLTEFRAVEVDHGVIAAGPDSIVLRAPYALGVSCGTNLTMVHVDLMPVDSVLFADARFAGYLWRDTTDVRYTAVEGAGVTLNPVAGTSPTCTTARVATSGQTVAVSRPATGPTPPPGAAILLFQRVVYRFDDDPDVPDARALYREVAGSPHGREMMAGPFARSARFRFFEMHATTATDAPPADLSRIRGVEVVLDGLSLRPQDGQVSRTTPMRTAVFFRNRAD